MNEEIQISPNVGLVDYSTICVGDNSPNNKKIKIKSIIVQSDQYIVYICEDNFLDWDTSDEYGDWDEGSGDILNRTSILLNKSVELFRGNEQYNIKCLIGEGVARFIEHSGFETAMSMLNLANEKIRTLGKEYLRITYLRASVTVTIINLILMAGLVMLRSFIPQNWGSDAYICLLSILGGGIGAFVSTFLRSQNYNANIDISPRIHFFDGVMRIFYGFIAALVVFSGIKANLVMGFINDLPSASDYVLFFTCSIAGASEVLLPSIIKQTEGKNAGTPNDKPKTE